ncbi:MAG: efflux RND transporter periplasmic adaptor subunit [Candidatus Korobacteraceae bacterium]
MKLMVPPLPALARESDCSRGLLRLGCAICMALLLLLSASCHRADSTQSTVMPSVPISVAQAEQRDVPIVVNAVGTIAPYSTVQIKTMVSAEINQAFFKEGDFVKKGQLLFQLDPRSFDADLLRAKGQLARDKATAVTARANANRYAALFKEGIIAREQYENMMSAADQAEAAVVADEGAVESARVSVTFTKIYSPINGRTGNLQLYPGNVSKANDLPLVTINEVSPIYASFAIPEQYLPEVKQQIAKGGLQVQATIPSTTIPADIGKVNFIDNTVDRTTGTITLKAIFPNKDNKLWPGQFVTVALTLSNRPNATTVPSQAVQSGQQGPYLFVVKADKTVEMRLVKLGPLYQGQLIVEQGVTPGETVVTDGHVRLVPGSRVEIKRAEGPQAVSDGKQEKRS